ncbi:MAG TPA: hypothetical protein VJB57_07130 [Dehalococcoidia bacterium]|nr:hypothetical protein [Dehalococcoidia bacterium]
MSELVVLRGGPKDGWVYDLAFLSNGPKLEGLVSSAEYRPTGKKTLRSDGAEMTIYEFVAQPAPEGEWVTCGACGGLGELERRVTRDMALDAQDLAYEGTILREQCTRCGGLGQEPGPAPTAGVEALPLPTAEEWREFLIKDRGKTQEINLLVQENRTVTTELADWKLNFDAMTKTAGEYQDKVQELSDSLAEAQEQLRRHREIDAAQVATTRVAEDGMREALRRAQDAEARLATVTAALESLQSDKYRGWSVEGAVSDALTSQQEAHTVQTPGLANRDFSRQQEEPR